MSSTSPTTSYSTPSLAPSTAMSTVPQVSMIVTQSITGPPLVTKSSPKLDDAQPVDLVSVKKPVTVAAPLKIPVPRPSSNIRHQSRPTGIISIPKLGSMMQVMQPGGNKMTVLQATQVAQKVVSSGSSPLHNQASSPSSNGPRLASGQAVIRGTMQVAPYPMTIRTSQASQTGAIRLTSTPQTNTSVQFVPVSLPNAPIKQLGSVAVRPGVAFRQEPTTVSPVRVTLMQQSVTGMKVAHQIQGVAQQSTMFKPLTTSSTSSSQTPVRIAPITASRMGIVPVSSHGLTVSIPSSSPQMGQLTAHNLVTTKSVMTTQPQRLPVPIMTSGGVTIQKMPVNVSVPSTQMTVARTVALPFSSSTTIVSANPTTIGKIISNSQAAIPVARVCPQQPTTVSSNNLVTISASGHLSAQIDANILIRRMTPAPPTSQLEINVSSSDKSNEMRALNVVAMPKITLPTQPARIIGYQNAQHLVSSNFMSSLSDHSLISGDQQQHLRVQTGMARPSILRRRDGEREFVFADGPTSPSQRIDNHDDGNETALSSPEIAPSSLLCTEELLLPNQISSLNGAGGSGSLSVEPSPRKKPRKQQLDNVRELKWSESDEKLMPEELKRKLAKPSGGHGIQSRVQLEETEAKHEEDDGFDVDDEDDEDIDFEENDDEDDDTRLTPKATLIDDNRFLWKCRYTYHFIHDSHVKGKDERKPTVNDLANQKDIIQKLDGWKIRYLTAQLFDIIDEENDLTHNLEDFQRRLDKAAHPDISGRKELAKVQELIKANLQRSKAIRDQITEAKDTTMEIFNHKPKVAAIVQKYESKRFIKKKTDLGL